MHLLPMHCVGPRVGEHPMMAQLPTGPAEHLPNACALLSIDAKTAAKSIDRTMVRMEA